MSKFDEYLSKTPIIAILRGITPSDIIDVCEALIAEGIKVIEVPLNSPDAFESIKLMSASVGERAFCGAGTVVLPEQAKQVAQCGGHFVVTPNSDPLVIKACIANNLIIAPGVATPTEAYQAIHAGATSLKVFPAGDLGVGYVKSMMAVLPRDIPLFAVGGVDEKNIPAFIKIGVTGFGIGSSLYKPGDSPEIVSGKAKRLVNGLS